MPVDYNSREHPYRVKQEFSPNHRHVPGFFVVYCLQFIVYRNVFWNH